jgi:SAM-dependent methyltransferase
MKPLEDGLQLSDLCPSGRPRSPHSGLASRDIILVMSPQPCIVCQSFNAPLSFRTRDRHYGIPGEFDIVRCAGCGLVHLDPVPTADELAKFYAQDYYAYQPIGKDGRLKALSKRLLKTKIETRNPTFLRPGNFLDIGCGSGEYLHKMQVKGWNVRGVEPSTFGAEEGRQSGLDIFHGTLCEANLADDSLDYVRSNHSFEHVPNPVEILDEIYRILRPGGKLFIGIPNIGSMPYRIFGKYWWYLGAPVHTYNYTIPTISTLIRRSGFVIDAVYFNSNFASLLGSLQIYANRNNGKKSTEGRLFRNPVLMLGANLVTRALDLIGQGDAIEVIAHKPTGLT